MKLLVIGDTHIPKKGKELPGRVIDSLVHADAVIHTGDWQTKEVYEMFLSYHSSLIGVYGNVDDEELCSFLPASFEWEACGYNLGLIHGHIGKGSTTEKRVQNSFDRPQDIVFFGHSHIPYLRYHGKTLYVNPGSAVDKRKVPFRSFAWIELTESGIMVEHKFF